MKENISKLFKQSVESNLSVDELIEKGKEILEPEFVESWSTSVNSHQVYGTMFYAATLDIVEYLKNNSAVNFTIAYRILESQNHSGFSYNTMLNYIKKYCKYGKEFCEYLSEVEKVVGPI